MLPVPAVTTAAAARISVLTATRTRELGSTGMSAALAVIERSAPKRTKAKLAAALVMRMHSPPPASRTLADVVEADNAAVPVARNGWDDPTGTRRSPQPTC